MCLLGKHFLGSLLFGPGGTELQQPRISQAVESACYIFLEQYQDFTLAGESLKTMQSLLNLLELFLEVSPIA